MTPDLVYHEKDFIYVFGSNLKGIHGAGAAKHAATHRGAHHLVPEGLSGTSYALPTKKGPYEDMSLNELRLHVDNFLQYATDHPHDMFQVTRVGCGRAGFKDMDVAPLFREAPDNCHLPGVWLKQQNKLLYRIIIAGSRGITDTDLIFKQMNYLLRNLPDGAIIEIVTGLAKGVDTLALEYGIVSKFKTIGFPAEWDDYKLSAGYIRNNFMNWYGTHLVAFWDGESKGTKSMIEMAKGVLASKVIRPL